MEGWILGLKKYFRIHDYSDNMKVKIKKFNLKGKEDICREDWINIKRIIENELSRGRFKKCFNENYLSERYYDNKIKEFHENKQG